MRGFRRAVGVGLLLPVVVAIFANWLVHQPRYRREAVMGNWPPWIVERTLNFGHRFAELTDNLRLSGSDNVLPFAQVLDTNAVACAGLPVYTNAAKQREIKVLKREGFVIGYSPKLRHPVWVAYKTDPRKGVLPPRPSSFRPDPTAPGSPKHRDYTRSGYDRGHMAPNEAIASRYGVHAQRQTFLTSNVCPQRPSLNQGPWRDIEMRISDIWPWHFDTIWVIVGTVNPSQGARKLDSGVAIPSAFYQIIVAQKGGLIYTCAVCMPQSIRRHAIPRINLVSIDELEEMTGLDFLPDLPDDVEEVLEAGVATRLLPAGAVGYYKILQERHRTYGSRKIGKR